ncbi:alpha/beta fold hydrolase [Flexivirga sp. ID2601S]|uniref:Alpha/beta fold hydrolase n=1 Tax=Flexivirga aerilata TaxID=1656889 RepID=A0A849AH24_9MICO|nr:alpha/beta fold hydrolase [Flexivirga aerilata]NNG37730.1 alpha/beta fold hydrolase [Flexivirga aerilata]
MTRPTVTLTDLGGGSGEPVLVLGPSLGTSVRRLWGAAVTRLSGFRVLGWDLPGHGSSPAAREPFTVGELAAAVRAEVQAALGEGAAPYSYAGDSIGGAVGLQLLVDAPDRCDRAMVFCGAAKFGTPEGWHDRAATVRAEGMAPLVASGPARWFGSAVVARPTADSRAVVQEQADVDAESYALACEALAAFDLTDRLPEIETPLLVVAGSDDVATPPDGLRALSESVAHGSYVELAGVGHLAPLEAPSESAHAILEHRRSAAGRSRRA